jgi:GNAT superfamily N-acetyltransferase
VFITPRQEAMVADDTSPIHIRVAGERDVDLLVEYFRNLSRCSRYNRFMEQADNFPRVVFQLLAPKPAADRFALIAELQQAAGNLLIGEASFTAEPGAGDGRFAISVSHDWHGRGVGSALLSHLQSRAIGLGHYALFGETLKTNEPMKALAQKAGFAVVASPDWRAIRFEKQLLVPSPGLQAHDTTASSI